MKKTLWIVLLCLAPVLGFAETQSPLGTLTVQGGVGSYWGRVAELQAGVDVGVTRVTFTPEFPLDFGASARAFVGFPGLAVGAYATATYDFGDLGTRTAWLSDLSASLGLGVQVFPGLGLDGYLGLRYQFHSPWGIFLEASGWGSVLGLSYRL